MRCRFEHPRNFKQPLFAPRPTEQLQPKWQAASREPHRYAHRREASTCGKTINEVRRPEQVPLRLGG